MAPNKKYLSLEEAAVLLGLQPEELVRLREKGDVRGFADRGTWKFKAEEIAEYRRRQQPDSDPDLPLMDFEEEDNDYKKPPANNPRSGLNSDSDVRLVMADDPKKKRLSGSSAEVMALDLERSDSDVRLVEAPKSPKKGSDSDVKIVKPKAGVKTDSDSDVKMIDTHESAAVDDSDSDVQMIQSRKSNIDSDSDVRMAHSDSDVKLLGSDGNGIDSDSDVKMAQSDSDVRLAPMLGSDSDVRIITKKSSEDDSDSDVMLLPRGASTVKGPAKKSDDDPLDFDLASFNQEESPLSPLGDSGIKLSDDSGIQLAGEDSGIRMADDSGIRLGGDSGIRLSLDSGVQLMQPADSGISLEGQDSGIRFADSGLTMAEGSGIKLKSPSSGSLGGKNKKAGPKKSKGDEHDDVESTIPMLMPDLDDLGETDALDKTMGDGDDVGLDDFDQFNANDTSEMQSMTESGQGIVIFEDDEEEEALSRTKKKRKAPSVSESLFAMDDSEDEPLEELEVSDEDLSGEGDFDDLSFDAGSGEHGDSFAEGSSQFEITAARKTTVVQEAEWGGGFFSLLLASLCVSIVGALISADLLRTVWATSQESAVDGGIVWLMAGLWK